MAKLTVVSNSEFEKGPPMVACDLDSCPIKHVRQSKWHVSPIPIIAIMITLGVQIGTMIWFASDLNARVKSLEDLGVAQRLLNREVIPRTEVLQRFDRMEVKQDTMLQLLYQHETESRKTR